MRRAKATTWWVCAIVMPLATGPVFAQDASLVPSIRQQLSAATNDTLRADALARLCFNLTLRDPDSARYFGERALALARAIGQDRALADAHNNLGWLETQQGHYPEAEVHLDSALILFRRVDNPAFISVALSNMGWWSDKQGDRVGALSRFQEALEQSERAQDTASTAILLYSIGTTYSKMKEYERARSFLERSLALERGLQRVGKEANCLLAIGNIWRSEGNAAKALEHYTLASQRYATNGDLYGSAMVAENSGDLFVDGDPKKALVHYQKALADYEALHSDADKAYILQRIGLAQVRLDQFVEAMRSYSEGLALAHATGSMELVMEYELSLAELAVLNGDSDKALVHYRRHMAMKDSLQSADAQRELMRLRAGFETDQAEKENALLKAENDLRRANEERLRTRWVAASTAVIALAALLLLLWRNFTLRGKHTAQVEAFNRELAAQRDQVQHMNDLLELKVLRSQLNPHFIYNCQSSAIAMMKEGRAVEALAYLQGFARLLRVILERSVKDSIPVEEEADLLRQYLKLEALRLEGLRYEVRIDQRLIDEEAMLPALIVQPFVENAVWHGLAAKEGTRELTVHFQATTTGLRCIVRDNGVGRSAEANVRVDGNGGAAGTHRSLGMELTNERLRLLTHRLQQRGSFAILDLKDNLGQATGTEVVIDLDDRDGEHKVDDRP